MKDTDKTLLQNRIDASIKDEFQRYSQLVGVPMNALIEQFIMECINKKQPQLKVKIWNEMGSG